MDGFNERNLFHFEHVRNKFKCKLIPASWGLTHLVYNYLVHITYRNMYVALQTDLSLPTNYLVDTTTLP